MAQMIKINSERDEILHLSSYIICNEGILMKDIFRHLMFTPLMLFSPTSTQLLFIFLYVDHYSLHYSKYNLNFFLLCLLMTFLEHLNFSEVYALNLQWFSSYFHYHHLLYQLLIPVYVFLVIPLLIPILPPTIVQSAL